MPNASKARIQYEEAQTPVSIAELTNQGDNLDFRSTDELWSAAEDYPPVVTPNGLYDGGRITVAASGSNDVVDISEARVYIAGVLTTISASVDEAIARPTATHIKYSIQMTAGGAFSVVAGAEHTAFSDTRGANGGPPYVLVDSTELGQVHLSSSTPAAIIATEIKQDGSYTERFDSPTWNVKYANAANGILGYAGILFNSALPLIHTGDVPKDVYASWHTPEFAEVPRAYDWVPPGTSVSVNSTQVYNETVGDVSESIGAGGFSALMVTNIADPILRKSGQTIWFKYWQNRLTTTIYQLCQGRLGDTRANPASANVNATFVIGAETKAIDIYA